MTDIPAITARNARRWVNMKFRSNKIAELDTRAKALIAHKDQYQAVSDGVFAISGKRIPWGVIAVIDEREHDPPFGLCNSFLGNGQSLGRVTTIEPKGQGPFLHGDGDTPLHGPFYRGALVALLDCAPRLGHWTDWSPGGALTGLTAYNGYGYDNKGLPSAYIWAATDQYVRGKYIADGVWSPTAVDQQLGCAALLRYMSGLDASVGYGSPNAAPRLTVKETKMTTPVAFSLADIEALVERFSFVVPFVTPFFPDAPLVLAALEGVLKAGSAIQLGADWRSTLADELRSVADKLHPVSTISAHEAPGVNQNATN